MTTRRGVGQDCIGSEGQGFPGLVVKKGTRRLFVGRDGRRTGAGEGILGLLRAKFGGEGDGKEYCKAKRRTLAALPCAIMPIGTETAASERLVDRRP